MKHELDYHIDIGFKNGKTDKLSGLYLDRMLQPHYKDVIKDITKEINKHLESLGVKFNNIKTINFTMEYSEEIRKSEEEEFFYELLHKTECVFQNSATRIKHPDQNWNFAICDTPIQKGKGLFFGLNWGGKDIDKQSVYPPKYKDRNWGFITNSRPYIKESFNENIEDLNYSNLCFFRSPNMASFVDSDWDKGIPLFSEYVNYVKPKWTLMLGNPPKQLKSPIYIPDLKVVKVKDLQKNKTLTVKGYTGTLFGRYPFGCVPHPQARISNEARHSIWEKVSNELKLRIEK